MPRFEAKQSQTLTLPARNHGISARVPFIVDFGVFGRLPEEKRKLLNLVCSNSTWAKVRN
jgi:hypothetical protein